MTISDQSRLSPMQRWLTRAPDTDVFRVDEAVVSRGELLAASEAAARHLYALGFGRGDVVCLLVPDSAVWLQFLFAASQIGVLTVPISTRYRDLEIAHVLETSRAKGVIFIRQFLKADFQHVIETLARGLPHLKHLIALDDTKGFFICPPQEAVVFLPEPDPTALLCTFGTSGTTGKPKLATHSQAGIAKHAEDIVKALEMDESTVTFNALPLYGVLGFISTMATIAAGGCCVSQPVYKADRAAQIIDDRGVTHFYGSDGLLDAVLRVPGHEFRRLRRGGFAEFAGLGRSLIDFAEQRFGLRLVGIYGSSECFALMALRDPGLSAERRAMPGGAPTSADIAFRIVDPATGEILPDRASGELQVSGPNVMAGYLNHPDATAGAMTSDGWFRTGDLAYREGTSFVFLSRIKDTLRLRGYLVDPTEIESYLTTHKSVGAAQVVGIHREGHGDVAVAFVLPCDGSACSEQELISYCASGISNYKVPSRIVFVDQFPEVSGPNGVKVQKNRLRELAAALVEKGTRL
jgi:acyl-CoA synthetase (AMP-forming)/AMP-acid ligase II